MLIHEWTRHAGKSLLARDAQRDEQTTPGQGENVNMPQLQAMRRGAGYKNIQCEHVYGWDTLSFRTMPAANNSLVDDTSDVYWL